MTLFKKLKDAIFGKEEEPNVAALRYTAYQKASSKGAFRQSRKLVVFISLDDDLRKEVCERLKPVLEPIEYEYLDLAKAAEAIDSRVLITDVRPKSDARLHHKYDTIIRTKKSRKKYDVICAIGRREDHKKFERGTYPGLLYFCYDEENPGRTWDDLPSKGQMTVIGPTLYNYTDIAQVIKAAIEDRF